MRINSGLPYLPSQKILMIRTVREPFQLLSMFKFITNGNWKAAVALYFNTNLGGLKVFTDRIRRK